MVKKLTLCVALLTSTLATATVQLDFDLTINEVATDYKRHIQSSVNFDDNNFACFEPLTFSDDIALEFLASEENEEGVTIECAVIQLNDNDENTTDQDYETLLANPIIHVQWNQSALIRLGNEKGDLLELTVTAHRNIN